MYQPTVASSIANLPPLERPGPPRRRVLQVLAREAREDLHEERATRLRAESATNALKAKLETLRRLTPGLQDAHQKHDAFAAQKYAHEESRRTPIPYDASVKRPASWGPVPAVLAPFVPVQDRLAGADPLLHVTRTDGYSAASRAAAADAAPPRPPQLNRHQGFTTMSPSLMAPESAGAVVGGGTTSRPTAASPALESMLAHTSIHINDPISAGTVSTGGVPASRGIHSYSRNGGDGTCSSVVVAPSGASSICLDSSRASVVAAAAAARSLTPAAQRLSQKNQQQQRQQKASAGGALTVDTYNPGMPKGPTPVFDPAPNTGINVLSGLVGRSSRRTRYCMGYDGKLVFNGHCERKENEERFKRAAAILDARNEQDRVTREALEASSNRAPRRASSTKPSAAVAAKIVADRLVRNPNLTVRGEEAYQAEPAGKEGGEKQYPLDRMQYWSSKRTRFYNDHSGKHVMMDECDWPTVKGFVLTGV